MESWKGIVFAIIFILAPLILGGLIDLTSKLIAYIKNYKYQLRLRKITPDLNSFDLGRKVQEYLLIEKDFELIKKDLILVFKIDLDKKATTTIGDIIKNTEKERIVKKKKRRFAYHRKY
jgi:hypothetical protein